MSDGTQDGPKYPKPNVMLIDLAESDVEAVKAAGYNVKTGTFGPCHWVARSNKHESVVTSPKLGPLAEAEVVVVDLARPGPVSLSAEAARRLSNVRRLCAECSLGYIDTRVVAMDEACDRVDRAVGAGAVLVVFAAERVTHMLRWQPESAAPGHRRASHELSSWGLSRQLALLAPRDDTVTEFTVIPHPQLGRIVEDHLAGGVAGYALAEAQVTHLGWQPLALSKYGDVVAAVRMDAENGGMTLIVPQLAEPGRFVVELLQDVLPELVPLLFPHLERGAWRYHDEYETAGVISLKQEKADVMRVAERRVAELDSEVRGLREADGWMYDLLDGDDDRLKDAAAAALQAVGFEDITDSDEEARGLDRELKEDLRVDSALGMLLIDTKGIGASTPADEDVRAVGKYIPTRTDEFQRFGIRGLTILNHQKHIEPLRRDAPHLRPTLLKDLGDRVGVLTAWDLHRLVRSFRRNGWTHEDVQDLFYQSGRIDPVPLCFTHLGRVEEVWREAGAIGVQVQADVGVGSRIALELPCEIVELEVASVQLNGKDVGQAKAGDSVGLGIGQIPDEVRKGMRVFVRTRGGPVALT